MEISVIEARDLSEAWFVCLRRVLNEGYEYKIDRGSYVGQQRKELEALKEQYGPIVSPADLAARSANA